MSGPTESAAEFALPGQIADRETVDGWKRWRLNRHSFVAAPESASTNTGR